MWPGWRVGFWLSSQVTGAGFETIGDGQSCRCGLLAPALVVALGTCGSGRQTLPKLIWHSVPEQICTRTIQGTSVCIAEEQFSSSVPVKYQKIYHKTQRVLPQGPNSPFALPPISQALQHGPLCPPLPSKRQVPQVPEGLSNAQVCPLRAARGSTRFVGRTSAASFPSPHFPPGSSACPV